MVAAIVADFITRVLITVVAMVYPGYQSYKAVKAADVEKQQAWLKYWLVLAVVAALNLVIEPILYNRVPMWSFVKIGAVAFLVLPQTKGYEKIYTMVLHPQLEKHEATIDATADRAVRSAQEQALNVRPQMEKMVAQAREYGMNAMNKKSS